MTIVKMVQVTPHTWQIVSQKGNVIQNEIIAHSLYEADQFIRKWVTSFLHLDYILVPLPK